MVYQLERTKEEEKNKSVECKCKSHGKAWSKSGLSPSSLQPQSMKRVRFQRSSRKNDTRGASSGTDFLVCGFCSQRHLGECWKKSESCLGCGSMEHRIKDYHCRPPGQNQVSKKTKNRGAGTSDKSGIILGYWICVLFCFTWTWFGLLFDC